MYETFGSFLQDCASAALQNSPTLPLSGLKYEAVAGLGETIPSDGGFLVPPEYAADLLERTYSTGQLLSRTTRMPMSSNRLKIPTVDESSRADGSRFGGLVVKWLQEGEKLPESKPQFAGRQLAVNKLGGACRVSGELLEDAPALGVVLERLFSMEGSFVLEDRMINGSGSGEPLGVLAAGCAIETPKETGQASSTLMAPNIHAMWRRMWSAAKSRATWLVSSDAWPNLNSKRGRRARKLLILGGRGPDFPGA